MRIRVLPFFVGIFLISSAPLSAADCPQWRGPERNGVSKETGLLQEWPKEGPKLLWQVNDAGYGFATPSVAGDRIYLISNQGADNEFVQARSVADGKQIWTAHLGKVGVNRAESYPGARSTPTVDGDRLYALTSDGDLACLKIADGAVVWHKSLPNDFGGRPGPWAYAESPLVDGDAVFCSPGGKEATIISLDKMTGKTIWKTALPEADEAAYASAIVVEIAGVRQTLHFLQKGVVGVDAKTGKFLWRYDKIAADNPAHIPTPISRDGFVYISRGATGGALFQVKGDSAKSEGEKFTVDPIYIKLNAPTRVGGAVLIGDYIYGTKATGLWCNDFKIGEEKWHAKSVGPGSICFADGRLYLHGEKGEVALVEPSPEAYREKGRFTPPGEPDRGNTEAWAYPIVANGRLYIRELGVLWCYDVSAAGAK